MMYSHTNFPTLTSDHMNNARLFASREDMVVALFGQRGGVVSEVGVAKGDFSRFLLDTLRPERFIAIDRFDLHTFGMIWGQTSQEIFGEGTHRDFYERTVHSPRCRIDILQGESHDCLGRIDDNSLDMVYIDAGHQYTEVSADAKLAVSKLKRNGLIIFNDYIMIDHLYNTPYGVVQAVNELVVSTSFKVVGFGLQHQLFCDIALRRS